MAQWRPLLVCCVCRPALALLLIALLVGQGVLATSPKLADKEQDTRKLMAAQKADAIPLLAKALWKGTVFLGEWQSLCGSSGRRPRMAVTRPSHGSGQTCMLGLIAVVKDCSLHNRFQAGHVAACFMQLAGKAGSAIAGIVKGAETVNKVISGTALAPPPAATRTVTAQVCTGPGGACAPPPPAARPSVNGCDNEGCLCQALGAGVHPNVFDNTCSTFFHCPGPKRPCGPGTLFHPDHRTCDWPANVKCVAVTSI